MTSPSIRPSRNTGQQRERVQSVERALAILRLLAAEGEPLRLAEVQRKTGLQKTVAHRLLQTLVAARFVEQDAESGRFHVGIGAFEVAQAYPHGSALIGLGRRHLSDLVGGSPHTAYLATRDGFEIVYLAAVEGTGPLRVHVRPGSRNPAYATAVGKVLLAELEDERDRGARRHLRAARLTPSTITTPAELLEQVHEVRAQGYALNSEEAYPGIGAIATAIRDADGEVRCAGSRCRTRRACSTPTSCPPGSSGRRPRRARSRPRSETAWRWSRDAAGARGVPVQLPERFARLADLSGRRALVTGGGRGLGLAIACALAEAGARVAVSGRHEQFLSSAVDELAAAAATPTHSPSTATWPTRDAAARDRSRGRGAARRAGHPRQQRRLRRPRRRRRT